MFGALGAALSSIKHTSVEATAGKVHVTGGKGVSIAGLKGNEIVASRDKDTEVWAQKGRLHLYSRQPFALADAEYGITTQQDSLFVGALGHVKHLKSVSVDRDYSLEIDKHQESAVLTAGPAKIELRDGLVGIYAKKAIGIKLNDMGVSIADGTLDILD